MKHKLIIGYQGYKYSPESFIFSVNGNRFNLSDNLRSTCAMAIISGNEKKAEDIIKREYRQTLKKTKYITIGFYKEGSKKDYFFTRQLYADKSSLSDKLRIYKEFKSYVLKQDCILNTVEVATGHFKPGVTDTPDIEVIKEKADINRPVVIKLV